MLACLCMLALGCTAPQPATQTGKSDTPVYGGTFNVPQPQDPFDFDMSYTGSSNANPLFIKSAYTSLMRMKTGPDIKFSQGVVEPLLAERWEVSPDATTFTFYLKKGVKFANIAPVSGREVTAADVKWSFEYMSRTGALKDAKIPASQFNWMFEGLQSVTTPDTYTVVVKFSDGFAPFVNYAASSDNLVMPKEIYEADGHFKDRVIGSGPFQLDPTTVQKGSSWTMKKNPTYFEEGKPYLEAIKVILVKDEATEQAAFRSKQIDYIAASEYRAAEEVKGMVPDAQMLEIRSTPVRFDLNLKRPPLDNFKVRKAISLAMDRDESNRVMEGGRSGWALAGTNVFDDLFSQEEIKTFVKYDIAEAKKLLTEAGHPNGVSIGQMVYSNADQWTIKGAELVQSQLKKAGINMELKPVDSNEHATLRRSKTFDILYLSEAQRADLDSSLHLMVHPQGSFNYASIDDPKITTLLAAQRKEINPEKRKELLRELLKYANESATLIPVWRRITFMFMQPYVKGWYHQADYRTVGSMHSTYLAK